MSLLVRLARSAGGALVAAAALALASSAHAAGKLEEGRQAVPFSGTDFLTGAAIDLEPVLGKRVILLDFGSIYCSSCMVTVPNLIKLRKKYPAEDLVILNIYLDIYNPQRVVKFFRGFAKDIGLGLMLDEGLAISREYGVDTLPTTVIIDRAGVIQRRIVGYTEADEREIDEIVERLVSATATVTATAAPTAAEEVFTVFTPESFTKTVQDKVFVVGTIGGAGTRDVAVKLNNLPDRVVTAKENYFHYLSPLSLAMNLIEVRGQVAEGRSQNQSIVIFRETRMGGDISSELPAYRFHRDEDKKTCRRCHKLEVPLQEKSTMQQSELCNECHSTLGKKIFTHGPITVGGCLPCHDYQSFPNRYELRSQGADLCYTCHDQIREQLKSSSYLHGPLAAGFCVVCHDPHAANERFLLVRKSDRLCISCHQDMLRELAKPTIHQPIQDGSCTGCHNPHAANVPKMLVQPRQTLCSKCHELSFAAHMHRVGAPASTEFPEGTPLSAEGTTVCYTCHVYHSSEEPKLARGPREVCGSGCHDAP